MSNTLKLRITTGSDVQLGEVTKAYEEYSKKFDENQQTELCIEVDENLAPKEIKFTIDK